MAQLLKKDRRRHSENTSRRFKPRIRKLAPSILRNHQSPRMFSRVPVLKYLTIQDDVMSIPGLGLEEPEETQKVESTRHDLAKECEWRFEVAVGKYIKVKILSGTAELFGTELVLSNAYTFTGIKAAIYTWHGCSFEVSGDVLQSEYTAEETPMNEYINVHFALETLRDQAKLGARFGPRLLILGPEDAGKSTLAKILTGYAVRATRSPVIVNLDSREGMMSVPGTLTSTVFKSLIDVEEGWGTAPMSGPNGVIPVKLPLVYFYGSEKPDDKDGKIYKSQISRLALAVLGRMAQDPEAREAGLIIDTPGSLSTTKASSNINSEILSHIVSEFSINCIICLGSERLYSDMVRRFDSQPVASSSTVAAQPDARISVIKSTKSGGCVDRDLSYMNAFRAAQIRTYFYGNPRLSNGIALQPRQQQIDFSALTVWRRLGSFAAGSLQASSTGGIPGFGGNDDDDDEFVPGDFVPDLTDAINSYSNHNTSSIPPPASQIFERVPSAQPAMRNCVLAVMNCEPDASQTTIRDSSVMGFLYVTDVDEVRGKISLLSPVAGRVPDRAIVWAGWPEGVLGMA